MPRTQILGCGLLAAATAFAAISTAHAASRLDGLYVGGQVGHDINTAETSYSVNGNVVSSLDGASMDGASGSLFAGYDIEFNNWHFAVEGEFGFGDASYSEMTMVNGQQVTLAAEARRSFAITGRYGYEVVEGALLYGRGGWVRTRFRNVFDQTNGVDGVRVGAGIEVAVSDRVSLRGEYNFTDYSTHTASITTNGTTETYSEDVQGNTVNFGVAVRF